MEQKITTLNFPQGFLWGASTSAYQIEGGLVNDWSEWEKSQLRITNYELQTGKQFNPEELTSGRACNSYELWQKDIECLKQINANAYRLSIDWSRVEPEEGEYSQEGIEYYKKIIAKLREEKIEPFITLWHWPLPLWLRDKGGWASNKTIKHFSQFTEKVVGELKGEVKFWITLNEPDVYSSHSYLKGDWPPQKRNAITYLLVLKNLIKAHQEAFKIIKKIQPDAEVGIAKHNIYFEAYQNKTINKIIKKLADWWWNFYFLNRIKKYQDFIGLNHYQHNRINYGFNKNENKLVNDFGWEIYPEAIYFVLMDLKKYYKPIYILENGLADEKDKYREYFIKETLKNVHRAISEGVDVRGYLHWSLLDNFEWAAGFTQKFGLFSVDRKTFVRSARPSANVYADICRTNKLKA